MLKVLLGFLVFASFLHSEEGQLNLNDVHKVMQEILKQHDNEQSVSQKVLQNAFKVYIEQFDPHHIYLLQSEIEPFLDPSSSDMNTYLEQYKNNNLTSFEKLNDLIRSSIERAIQYRKMVYSDPERVFQQSTILDLSTIEKPKNFAKNLPQLKQHIRNNLAEFIYSERRKLGEKYVKSHQKEILDRYENAMRIEETPYMGVDENGTALKPAEKENLFAMHILKALTNSLDAHSNYLDASEAFEMKVRLEKKYQGIGVELKTSGDKIVISRLIPGGPAAKSGQVAVNDQILAIDDKSVSVEKFRALLDQLHDTSNPIVVLTLKRADNTFKVQLVRSDVAINDGRVQTAFQKYGNGIIGYILLKSFYRGDDVSSEKDIRDAIQKLKKQGNLRGLILDLRSNTGGFLTEAVKVAGLFITDGIIVISKYSSGGEHIYRDVDGKTAYNGPLIVLTSKGTASAAEIVAQALQDYGVAVVVGDDRTYGKGTIQSQTVTESNNAAPHFKVTVGKYFTVSGKSPQIRGVKSDVVVPGMLTYAEIGEKYLENAESEDEIPAEYDDKLEDIDENKKYWYIHYYTPRIQRRNFFWNDKLDELREHSQKRLQDNSAYQMQLRELRSLPPTLFLQPIDKTDLQLQEVYNIMKEMISLENQN